MPDTSGAQQVIADAEDAKQRMKIRSSYVTNVKARVDARIDDNHFSQRLREAWAMNEAEAT